MAQYAAIQNGVITGVILWDGVSPYTPGGGVTLTLMGSLPPGVWLGWSLNGGNWVPPAAAPIPTTGLTFQQFCSLFTSAEMNTIITGCTTNPTILIGFLKLVASSGVIDVNSAAVQADLAGLVTLGMITSARKTAIQAGVVMNLQA